MVKLFNILLLFASFVIFSCDQKSTGVEVGFLVSNTIHERWVNESAFFTKQIEAQGGKVIVKSADNDENLQYSQALELINSGVDILVVNAVNGVTAASIVRAAHANGIKVVAYDRMIKNCDLDYFITFDGEKVGELIANYALKLEPTGNYVLLNGDKADDNAIYFYNGTMKILKPAIDANQIKIVFSTFVEDYARVNAEYFADKVFEFSNVKIDAILTPYDGLAEGVFDVLSKRGLVDSIPVTGQDAELLACNRIMNGSQTMTVYKPGKNMASKCAEMVLQIVKKETIKDLKTLNNGRIDVASLVLDPVAVDKSNMASTVVADGVFTMDEIMKSK